MAISTPADEHEIFRAYLDAVGLHGVAGAHAVGLSPSEWYALSQLGLAGTLTSGELSSRVGLTTGATTRLVDRLERAGFVRRVTDPYDRRKVIIEPIPEALGRIEEVVQPAKRAIGSVLSRYTPEQRAVLFDYFRHAAPAYRAATEEVRSKPTERDRRESVG